MRSEFEIAEKNKMLNKEDKTVEFFAVNLLFLYIDPRGSRV